MADGLSRSERWSRSRSRASGTIGAASGTEPSASPTTSRRCTSRSGTSDPSQSTAWVASFSSVSPTEGRPRTAASASASRTASTTVAGAAGSPSSRRARATLVSQPDTDARRGPARPR